MQANAASPPGDADLQQIDSLCDDLSDRADTARTEQVLLGQLIESTARTRPFRSRQYRALLQDCRERYRKLRELIARYCR